VSQISNFTVVSSRQTVCVKKAAPIVLSWYSWNWPFTKRSTRLDLPTADSPSRTSLNWQILPWVAPLGRWAGPADVEAAALPLAPPRFAMFLQDTGWRTVDAKDTTKTKIYINISGLTYDKFQGILMTKGSNTLKVSYSVQFWDTWLRNHLY